jgi:hypothetical protein
MLPLDTYDMGRKAERRRSEAMKKTAARIGILAVFMLLGAAIGLLLANSIDFSSGADSTDGELLLVLALIIPALCVAFFLQVVIHESGHLIGGLLSGYRFLSFRVGSLMWIREGDGLRFKRMSIAGTGGQCLMSPPEMVNGKMPFVLYNLAGSLANLIFGLLFFGLCLPFWGLPWLVIFLLPLGGIGLLFALLNGIPLQLGGINNDGHNAFSLKKSEKALYAFWVQMKMIEQYARGVRLKDMPGEWFVAPTPDEMDNSMSATLGVLAANRLMDAHSFTEADRLMETLLEGKFAIVGLRQSMMTSDRIYCELIGENRRERLDALLDCQQKKFMQTMRNNH